MAPSRNTRSRPNRIPNVWTLRQPGDQQPGPRGIPVEEGQAEQPGPPRRSHRDAAARELHRGQSAEPWGQVRVSPVVVHATYNPGPRKPAPEKLNLNPPPGRTMKTWLRHRGWIRPRWPRSVRAWREHLLGREGPRDVVRGLIVALLADGHVLIEDYPGVGKTALARALARSLEAEYARVQCTADLLPADSSAPTSSTSATAASSSTPARCSRTSCSSTRSTAPRRRPSPGCSSACRSARSRSTRARTSWPARFSCSRPRTRPSTREPIRCPRHSSTASWSGCRSAIPRPTRRPTMLAEHAGRDPVVEARAGRRRRRRPGRAGRPPARSTGTEALRRYVVALCEATRERRAGRARREPARRR